MTARPKRIKVLMLSPNLSGGGAERVFLTICRHLDRSRFDITIGVLTRVGQEHSADIPADLPLVELGIARARYAVPALLRLIRRTRPDLVFCTGAELNLAVSVVASLRRGREVYVAREPNVATTHNSTLPNARLRAWMTRTTYRAFDAIVCQSTAMRADLFERYRLPVERLPVINNPVDIEWVRQQAGLETLKEGASASKASQVPKGSIPDWPTGYCHIVGAGRLDYQKDFGLLIEALVRSGNPRLHLTVLGEGPQRTELQALAEKLGVADRVNLRGFTANPYPYLAAADVLVISSRYEGMPNVGLEALACGTPVISFAKVNGLDDLVSRCHGITLLRERSVLSLAQALDNIAQRSAKPEVDVSSQDSRAVVRAFGDLFEVLVARRHV